MSNKPKPTPAGMFQTKKGRKVQQKTQENLAIFDQLFDSYKNLDMTLSLQSLNRKSSAQNGINKASASTPTTATTSTSELDSSTYYPTSESEDQRKKVQRESKDKKKELDDLKVTKQTFNNLPGPPSKELLDLLSKSSTTKKKDLKSRSKSRKVSKANINYDVFYRAEKQESVVEEEAQILWKRREEKEAATAAEVHTTRTVSFKTSRAGDSSETEPEMRDYMKLRKSEKRALKKKGQNYTGETLLYDKEHDVIRNLHRDSISLTGYGRAQDHHLFGKSGDMFPLLTSDELKMLGVGDSRNSQSDNSLRLGRRRSDKKEVGSGEGF